MFNKVKVALVVKDSEAEDSFENFEVFSISGLDVCLAREGQLKISGYRDLGVVSIRDTPSCGASFQEVAADVIKLFKSKSFRKAMIAQYGYDHLVGVMFTFNNKRVVVGEHNCTVDHLICDYLSK